MMPLVFLHCPFYNVILTKFILPQLDKFSFNSASINKLLSDESAETTWLVAKFCSQAIKFYSTQTSPNYDDCNS